MTAWNSKFSSKASYFQQLVQRVHSDVMGPGAEKNNVSFLSTRCQEKPSLKPNLRLR